MVMDWNSKKSGQLFQVLILCLPKKIFTIFCIGEKALSKDLWTELTLNSIIVVKYIAPLKPCFVKFAVSCILETFRFEDENHYEYEIWFKVFSRILKK